MVILVSCDLLSPLNNKKINPKNGKYLTMALAGNANVGKYVRFDKLMCLKSVCSYPCRVNYPKSRFYCSHVKPSSVNYSSEANKMKSQ